MNHNFFSEAWAGSSAGTRDLPAFAEPSYTSLYGEDPVGLSLPYEFPSRSSSSSSASPSNAYAYQHAHPQPTSQQRWSTSLSASYSSNRRASIDDARIPNISVKGRSISPQPPAAPRRVSQDWSKRATYSPSLAIRRHSRQMERPQPVESTHSYSDYVFPASSSHRRSSMYNLPSTHVTPPTPTDYFKSRPTAAALASASLSASGSGSGSGDKKKRPRPRTSQDLLLEMPIRDVHLRREDKRVLRHGGLLVPIQGLEQLKALMSHAFDNRGFQLASYVEWAPHGVQGRQTNKIRIFVCGQGIRVTQGQKFEKTGVCGFEVRFEAQHHKSDATAVWRLINADLSHGQHCTAHRHH